MDFKPSITSASLTLALRMREVRSLLSGRKESWTAAISCSGLMTTTLRLSYPSSYFEDIADRLSASARLVFP